MTEDTPLTVLCAICHTGAPKYTCPRCGIHTCSLPCVKLHKTRASCTGIRDPAAYRKRNELITASSIDSDFNFITSLERSIAGIDESTTAVDGTSDSTHLQAAGLNSNKARSSRQTDSARLERLVKDRGVQWRRAPRGMRRRQENQTRVEHSGVTWTLEFRFTDRSRTVSAVPEGYTVGEALERATRPRPCGGKNLGKRKRVGAAAGRDGTGEQNKHERQREPESEKPPPPSPPQRQVNVEEVCGSEPPLSTAIEQPPEIYADHHIYIHRPNTPSKLKVLAPLQRSDKLIDVLKGRVVMEYPTLYIKSEPPDALAPPFVTEADYLREHGEDVVPLADTNGITNKQEADSEDEEGEIPETAGDLKQDTEGVLRALADPSKVMSVLDQDLKA